MRCPYGLDLTDEEIDNYAVSEFARKMKEKLAIARAKGRRGWDDKEACSDKYLVELFYCHLEKCNDGNFIDLANFLMFLHVRGAKSDVLIKSKNNCDTCKFITGRFCHDCCHSYPDRYRPEDKE